MRPDQQLPSTHSFFIKERSGQISNNFSENCGELHAKELFSNYSTEIVESTDNKQIVFYNVKEGFGDIYGKV